MKGKVRKCLKSEALQYFKYAMWSFGGLCIEVVYAFLLEPIIYGHTINEFTTTECIIHWSLTIITWITIAFLILRDAKTNLNFRLKGTDKKWTVPAILASCILVGLMMVINFVDMGKLKIVHEFQILGTLQFMFQHLYYLAEVVLFTLIIVFGQNFLEKLFRKKNFPYGGIIMGLTWGLGHWFTKGSMWIGVFGLVLGFLFGAMYLFLGRDVRKTYIVLALTFII